MLELAGLATSATPPPPICPWRAEAPRGDPGAHGAPAPAAAGRARRGLNDGETAELATLLRAVRDSGVTLLVVEHNMSLVMGVADEIIVLDAGTVIARGTPARSSAIRVIEAYIGQTEGLPDAGAAQHHRGYGRQPVVHGVSLTLKPARSWRWWAPTVLASRRW